MKINNYKTCKETEGMIHTLEKKQAAESISKSNQILGLVDKNFEVAIINTFKELKNCMIYKIKKGVMALSNQIENISKETNCKIGTRGKFCR